MCGVHWELGLSVWCTLGGVSTYVVCIKLGGLSVWCALGGVSMCMHAWCTYIGRGG